MKVINQYLVVFGHLHIVKFIKGVDSGLVGVFTKPISGVLDLVAAEVEVLHILLVLNINKLKEDVNYLKIHLYVNNIVK